MPAEDYTPDDRLKAARHELRDWIVDHFDERGATYDTRPLADELNAAIERAGLAKGGTICQETKGQDLSKVPWGRPCGEVNGIGLERVDDFLIVSTGFSTLCSSLDAAYVYERRDAAWQLLWEDETEDLPIISVQLSKDRRQPGVEPLIAVLAGGVGCEGTWGEASYRLWRARSGVFSPEPILAGGGFAHFLPDGIGGTLEGNRLTVEYTAGSISTAILDHHFVGRFRVVAGDRIERVAPVAATPLGFVEEWLTRPWPEAGHWIDPIHADTLREIHEALTTGTRGEFDDLGALACRADPTLWQVAYTAAINPQSIYDQSTLPTLYFSVRWLPPYRFTLVKVGSRPTANCDREDRLDDAPRWLFLGPRG